MSTENHLNQHEKKSKHKMAYDLAEIIDTADTKTKLQANGGPTHPQRETITQQTNKFTRKLRP